MVKAMLNLAFEDTQNDIYEGNGINLLLALEWN